jgi:biopolymer transport protein ExbB
LNASGISLRYGDGTGRQWFQPGKAGLSENPGTPKKIRQRLLSESRELINDNMNVIATCVALCPLLGLLGTVTGMIEVFNVMAVTGGGDAKSMAGGVERSTIPTMAGMVAALSGLFANTYLQRITTREQQLLTDQLTSDH